MADPTAAVTDLPSTSSNQVDVCIQTNEEDFYTTSSTKILDDEVSDTSSSSDDSTTTTWCHEEGSSDVGQPSPSFANTHSAGSTRRSSSSSMSSLGTPLHILFSTSSSSRNASQLDSPVSATPEVSLLNGLDQLLNRITSERFLELRRIQLGDRPVTNGNARSSLENFFHRAINGPTAQERNSEEETNRPENVASDVQSLLQMSRVRSALQNGFGNRLESTLSGRVQTPEATPSATRRNNRTTRIPSGLGSNESVSSNNNNNNNGVIPFPPPPPSSTMGEYQQQQQQQQQRPSDLRNTVETSVQLLTESIATDLTRLQSLQVVNNILRTDFRQELERMVQQRVETSGNGEAVSEFIRTLPSRPRRPPPTQQHRMPTINEGAAASNHEIHELRQQLQEMKQLMAMSMEIQLDTQRAIRQEVSAVFTAFMQAEQSNEGVRLPAPVHPTRSTPIERGQCVICIDKSVDTVLYQCGHMCVCHSCALQLKMNGQNCPMCRASIRDVIRAYVINE